MGDLSFVWLHIQKTPEYVSLLSADEAWVVHFTCEQDYHPIWQSNEELLSSVNVVHFAHDLDFTNVVMSTHWKDRAGNIQREDGRLLTVWCRQCELTVMSATPYRLYYLLLFPYFLPSLTPILVGSLGNSAQWGLPTSRVTTEGDQWVGDHTTCSHRCRRTLKIQAVISLIIYKWVYSCQPYVKVF